VRTDTPLLEDQSACRMSAQPLPSFTSSRPSSCKHQVRVEAVAAAWSYCRSSQKAHYYSASSGDTTRLRPASMLDKTVSQADPAGCCEPQEGAGVEGLTVESEPRTPSLLELADHPIEVAPKGPSGRPRCKREIGTPSGSAGQFPSPTHYFLWTSFRIDEASHAGIQPAPFGGYLPLPAAPPPQVSVAAWPIQFTEARALRL
jgi:hypothetical protein